MNISTPGKKVAHFVRKSSQLRASFIRNQIFSHIHYEPALVWRKNISKEYDGGYAEFDFSSFPALDLSSGQGMQEKILFKGPKILSRSQIGRVAKFLKQQEVSICHFHYGSDCGIFFPLLRKLNIPSVVSFYGYDCSSFPSWYMGYGKLFLKNRVFKEVSAVLAMSPDMKKDLMKAGCPEEKIIVHYYGTDCRRFFMEREYPDKKEITMLMLASLVPQKGHKFLFQSLLKLKDSGIRNWKLRLVGVGESEEELKAFVAGNDLSDQVTFVGGIAYGGEAMIQEYRQADIFVHPSVVAENGDKEGIPGTIVEAMAAGLPVIATYHAGIPYIIENNKTGLLVKEWDREGLRESMARLMANPNLRQEIGKRGQAFAMNSLDLHAKEKELEAIYSFLIEHHGHAPLAAGATTPAWDITMHGMDKKA